MEGGTAFYQHQHILKITLHSSSLFANNIAVEAPTDLDHDISEDLDHDISEDPSGATVCTTQWNKIQSCYTLAFTYVYDQLGNVYTTAETMLLY